MKERNSTKLVKLPATFVPQFWQDADGRNSLVREIRRRVETLKTHTGADSAQKQMLCERAVFIGLQLETQERQAVETGRIDLGSYTQGSNALLGLLKALGLEKHAIQVGGDLKAYLKRIEK